MRIAVSGTHSVGKSTLVWDFIKAFPGYVREEEPYRALCAVYPIQFGAESTRYCNGLQTYYSLGRTQGYARKAKVIFDRCPVDYIPYSMYTARKGKTDIDRAFVKSLVEPIRQSLGWLDLIVFVPMSVRHPMHLENDGIRPIDKAYRSEVDRDFKRVYREGLYDLFREKSGPRVVEITGSREERIGQLRRLVK